MKNILKKDTENKAEDISDSQIENFNKEKKKKKRRIILGISGAAIVLGAVIFYPKNTVVTADGVEASLRTIENRVSLSGKVESENNKKVYNKVFDEVLSVDVKLGQHVKKGDVLAVISKKEVEREIEKQKVKMSIAQQNNVLDVYEAQKQLDDTKFQIEAGTYDDIELLNEQIQQAAVELSNRRREYKEKYDDLDIEKHEEKVRELERNMIFARKKMEDRERALKKQGLSIKDDKEYMELKNTYEEERNKWLNSYNLYMEEMSTEGRMVQAALLEYDNLLKRKERQHLDLDDKVDKLDSNLKKVKLSSDMTLEELTLKELLENLDNCTVKAPMDGMITSINIKAGEKADELLFTIEDDNNLTVNGSLRDFDLLNVEEGQQVKIKSSVTGDKEIKGVVSNVSFASEEVKNSDSQNAAARFPAEIKVIDKDTGLLLGSNVRMKITTEKKDNVIAVPFDAVITDPDGKQHLYKAEKSQNGYIAVKQEVKIGMETDFEVEITEGVNEGDIILRNSEMLTDKQKINLSLN